MGTILWGIFNIVFIILNSIIIRSGNGLGMNYFGMFFHFLALICIVVKEIKK